MAKQQLVNAPVTPDTVVAPIKPVDVQTWLYCARLGLLSRDAYNFLAALDNQARLLRDVQTRLDASFPQVAQIVGRLLEMRVVTIRP